MAKEKRLPQVRVGDRLYEAVAEAAEKDGKSISEVVRDILEQALLPQSRFVPVYGSEPKKGGE
jgi:hypothetical protein